MGTTSKHDIDYAMYKGTLHSRGKISITSQYGEMIENADMCSCPLNELSTVKVNSPENCYDNSWLRDEGYIGY